MKKNLLKATKPFIAAVLTVLLLAAMCVPALATITLEITRQPQNKVFMPGSTATYEIEVDGENLTPDSYHWYIVYEGKTYDTMKYKEGDPWVLAEECGRYTTGNGYWFNGIQPELEGAEIYCVVSDGKKTVTSDRAIIQVSGTAKPPAIIKVPESVTIPKNYGDGMLKLACQTDSPEAYTFQWYETSTGKLQNIIAIDCTDPIYPLPTSKAGKSYYVCMVTTPDGGRAYSSVIPVTIYEEKPQSTETPEGSTKPDTDTSKQGETEPVAAAINILTQPTDASAKNGEKIAFSCKAEGNVKYQWWLTDTSTFSPEDKSAVKLSEEDNYSGTGTDTLTVTAGDSVNGKYFVCEITGENGEKTYTNTAKLSVTDLETDKNAAAEQNDKGLSTGIIILISFLVVALIAAITAVIVLLVNMKKKKGNQ